MVGRALKKIIPYFKKVQENKTAHILDTGQSRFLVN